MQPDNFKFSQREKDVVNLLLKGKGNKQIALELGISTRTVEFHLTNIYAKLGVNSRSEAIIKFEQSNLRESTGALLGETAVTPSGDSTENRTKSILRSNTMKNFFTIIAGLSLTVLIAAILINKLSAHNPESVPTTPTQSPIPTNEIFRPSPTVEPSTSNETPAIPLEATQQTTIVAPTHTVNGYTATIESQVADASHILFQVRLTGGETVFGSEHFYHRIGSYDIYDENGNRINTSSGSGPAMDPSLYQFEFVPVTLLTGTHIKGQFAFNLTNTPEYEKILAQFRFDFDLPLNPDNRFNPQQTATANNLSLLLDSITITNAYTQTYICFPPLTNAPWTIGNQTELRMDGQNANPVYSRELFNSETSGDRRAGSEPYWVPPIKNGRCIKNAFPIGSSHPTSFTLIIPQLEIMDPDVLLGNQLLLNYPTLNEKQAYYTFIEEHGTIYKGPWTFNINRPP